MSAKLNLSREGLALLTAVLFFADSSHGQETGVEVLHTFTSTVAHEVATVIPVASSKLAELLPPGYAVLPASALGLGSSDQGLVGIINFRDMSPVIDGKADRLVSRASIDVVIFVSEPDNAVQAGVNIPGAFHFYTLEIYTESSKFAGTVREGGMPIELVKGLTYERQMDDASGFGNVTVTVPSKKSPFKTVSTGFGYVPQVGALNAVLWHAGDNGQVALHFRNEPHRRGDATSQVYTKPDSRWDKLLSQGGLGSCAPDPTTGYSCVNAFGVNLRYDAGENGRLLLIEQD